MDDLLDVPDGTARVLAHTENYLLAEWQREGGREFVVWAWTNRTDERVSVFAGDYYPADANGLLQASLRLIARENGLEGFVGDTLKNLATRLYGEG